MDHQIEDQPSQPVDSRPHDFHGVILKNVGCTNRHIYVTPFRAHRSKPESDRPFVIEFGSKFEASSIEMFKNFLTNLDQRVVQICFHKHNVLCTDAECNYKSYPFTSTADCVDHFVSCIPDDELDDDQSNDSESDDSESDDSESDDSLSDDSQTGPDLEWPNPDSLLLEPQHLSPHQFSTNPDTQAMVQHLYNFGEFDAVRQLLERDNH